jgi:S-adenosylmethionine/arginine decarboxylase-like enzyme
MNANEDSKLWGWHLSLNLSGCDLLAIKNKEKLDQFTRQLVKDIDMVPYGDPQIVYFGHEDKSGYTILQLIETSNICAHFVDELESGFLDIFSCKEFDKDVVINLIKEYFNPVEITSTYQERRCSVFPR